MQSKLESALHLAALGFRIFPLIPNSKKPAIARWRQRSTSDAQQIRAWWAAAPERNIGIDTAGCIAIDVDNKGAKRGSESLHLLEMLWGDLPPTYRQRTPTGGLHVVYRGDARNSASRIAAGIDVRGTGGYIVGAGSTIDGAAYKAVDPSPIVPAPKWIVDQCEPPARDAAERAPATELDEPQAIARAKHYLEHEAPIASQGAGGDAATFAVAARVKDFGVSEPAALELLLDHWNETCAPPWGPEELAVKVENAYRYGREAPGAASPIADFEGVPLPPAAPATPRAKLFFEHIRDVVPRVAANFLIDGIIDRGAMSVMYGQSNTGKSYLAVDMAQAVAAGRPFHGHATSQGAVVYVAAEAGNSMRQRFAALKQRHGADYPLCLVPCPVDLLRPGGDVQALIALIAEAERTMGQRVVLIVLDTLSRVLAGGQENDSADMGALVKHVDALRAAGGAHVTLVHHSGKNQLAGARGHSLLRAATDTEIEVTRDDPRGEIRMQATKQRDMDYGAPLFFDLDPITLGTRDDGKVVEACVVRYVEAADIELAPTTLESELLSAARNLAKNRQGKVVTWGEWFAAWAQDSVGSVPPRNGRIERHATNIRDTLAAKGCVKKINKNNYKVLSELPTEHDISGAE